VLDVTAVRYIVVGLANTLIGLFVIYMGLFAFGLGNVSANAVGYTVGILCSFALNKRWTFSHEGKALPAFIRFLVIVLLAYAANLATVLLAADVLGWNRYVAQGLGVVPYVVVGYVGSRLFAFRSPARQSARDRLPRSDGARRA